MKTHTIYSNLRISCYSKLIVHYVCRQTTNHGDEVRACLDRRRLEEAHLRYAIVMVYRDYPGQFTSWKVSCDIRITLEKVSSVYYKAFSARYAGIIIL